MNLPKDTKEYQAMRKTLSLKEIFLLNQEMQKHKRNNLNKQHYEEK